MWIYLSESDGLPGIVLYDYRPGRGGENPIEFLSGFKGLLHCDGYSAYGRIEDVVLVCCLAHCRRKFYEAVPTGRRKKLKLLDINSEEELKEPSSGMSDDNGLLPAEKGVAFCNRLFFLERCYKELPAEERKQKRQEKEPEIWNEFWSWLGSLNPTGGSKLEKAVNYAFNHKETLMNYLLDGRCEISNNAAERRAKSYATARKNFLFHDTVDGANASAIVMSLIETAKANNLNIYQYLYTLLLYMPDYKNEPAGIKQLMPWSEFIKENCSGITDTEKITQILKKIMSENELYILINNAGVGYYGLHEELNAAKIKEIVRTNFEAPMILSQLVLRQLKKSKGFIINISSVTALQPSPHGCAYGASKAGLTAFSRSLFDEARKYGVKVVSVHPDMTSTDLYRNADFKEDEDMAAHLEPQEVAQTVEYIINIRDGAVIQEITIKPQFHRIRRK